ncbi:MAG: hypothetical protein ACP5I6_05140 [Caldisphaera sp.]|jgi:hypothetical protein|nr:MAG: hypothetical protein C0201_04080 [Caldisphaera sp.]PMP92078.1 MAG: hypothetical protein C0171_01500 [Caldisphaera sp.]
MEEKEINDTKLKDIKEIIENYKSKAYMLNDFVERSLNSMRWQGIGILMILDASFTSVGLNYFNAVIPAILKFKRKFYDTNEITNFHILSNYDLGKLKEVWKNERSWIVAKNISKVFSKYRNKDDRETLIYWAKTSSLNKFKNEEISKIKGVGIVTFQYLRIMGGIDTLMPDKIVIKFLDNVFSKSKTNIIKHNIIEYIYDVENLLKKINIRPVEVTWISWLIDSEAKKILTGKYNDVLNLI